MPAQRKRTASASLGSTETGRPTRKAGRFALSKVRKDNTHGEGEGSEPGQGQGNQPGPSGSQGVPVKFPWVGLPIELQERIMSNLTVRDTANFTWAVQSCNVRAIHREMVRKRHEALLEIIRREGSERTARCVPPLDLAKPAHVDVNYQAPSLVLPHGPQEGGVQVHFPGNLRGHVPGQGRKGKKGENVLDQALDEFMAATRIDPAVRRNLPGGVADMVIMLPGRCKGCFAGIGGLDGAAWRNRKEMLEVWRRLKGISNGKGKGKRCLKSLK